MNTQFPTAQHIYEYLATFIDFEKNLPSHSRREYRLDRMRTLLDHFGHPERDFRSLHVAGTKGKGSTAELAASVLRAAGHKVGVYASPHVSDFSERITMGGSPLPVDILSQNTARIRETLEAGLSSKMPAGVHPTFFELLTLLAFMSYSTAGCDYVVVEVGIGGRLDATNVIDPLASLISPLDLEHTHLLGDTLESIAYEKGGIIKPGRPVFSADQAPEARAVFRRLAEARGASLEFVPDAVRVEDIRVSGDGTRLRLTMDGGAPENYRLRMLGRFQAENAALAALCMRRVFPELSPRTLRDGLENAWLPGRMELVRTDPPTLLDGAHTPLAVGRLLESAREMLGELGILVFGAVEGKNVREMARLLAPVFSRVIVTTPGTFKSSDPKAISEVFEEHNPATELVLDAREAVERALESSRGAGRPVVVTGSFYLLGEVRELLLDRVRAGSHLPAL